MAGANVAKFLYRHRPRRIVSVSRNFAATIGKFPASQSQTADDVVCRRLTDTVTDAATCCWPGTPAIECSTCDDDGNLYPGYDQRCEAQNQASTCLFQENRLPVFIQYWQVTIQAASDGTSAPTTTIVNSPGEPTAAA